MLEGGARPSHILTQILTQRMTQRQSKTYPNDLQVLQNRFQSAQKPKSSGKVRFLGNRELSREVVAIREMDSRIREEKSRFANGIRESARTVRDNSRGSRILSKAL